MIRLESEIARREANLASLQAQQRYLDDQTSLSTIARHDARARRRGAAAAKDDPLEDAGFLTGLQNGWNALVDVLARRRDRRSARCCRSLVRRRRWCGLPALPLAAAAHRRRPAG